MNTIEVMSRNIFMCASDLAVITGHNPYKEKSEMDIHKKIRAQVTRLAVSTVEAYPIILLKSTSRWKIHMEA